MELRIIKIKDLKFQEYNPRTISNEAFELLKQSLSNFGFTVPNTVNMFPGRENVLIGGHQRSRAWEALGNDEVPCFIVSLDQNKEKLLNIALNNYKMQGQWDKKLLADMLISLQNDEAPVKLSGFDEEDVQLIIDDVYKKEKKAEENNKDICKCERCEELRKQITGHEKKSGHLVYNKVNDDSTGNDKNQQGDNEGIPLLGD